MGSKTTTEQQPKVTTAPIQQEENKNTEPNNQVNNQEPTNQKPNNQEPTTSQNVQQEPTTSPNTQSPLITEFELKGHKKYQKIREIGRGSFGQAILVKNIQNDTLYVMKIIPVQRLPPEQQQAAMNEVNVLKMLKHENIIEYHESFTTPDGYLCIVMSYADGGDIYQKIHEAKGQHFLEEQIIDWFAQIACGLKHIHDRNILHRDLKTQNIFLTKDNKIKLGDFGISKILNSENDLANTFIGTPYYLAPELCENKGYNQKSDVWALGCVLYEMTTLKHAFNAKNIGSLILKILKGDYPPIPKRYSANLRKLINSMLQRDPNLRPSIDEILSLPFIQKRNAKAIYQQRRMSLITPPTGRQGAEDRSEWLMKKAKELESLNLELHPSQRINLDTLTREQIKKQLMERKDREKQKYKLRRKQLKEAIKNRKSPTEVKKKEKELPAQQAVFNKYDLIHRRQSCTIRRPFLKKNEGRRASNVHERRFSDVRDLKQKKPKKKPETVIEMIRAAKKAAKESKNPPKKVEIKEPGKSTPENKEESAEPKKQFLRKKAVLKPTEEQEKQRIEKAKQIAKEKERERKKFLQEMRKKMKNQQRRPEISMILKEGSVATAFEIVLDKKPEKKTEQAEQKVEPKIEILHKPLEKPQVEPQKPQIEPQKPQIEHQKPLIEPQKPLIEPQKPLIEPQKPPTESQKPPTVPKNPLIEPQTSLIETKKPPSREGETRLVNNILAEKHNDLENVILPVVDFGSDETKEKSDNLAERIEKLRQDCEHHFGKDLLVKLYDCLRSQTGDQKVIYQKLLSVLGPQKENLYPYVAKIQHLIYCEDIFYGHGNIHVQYTTT